MTADELARRLTALVDTWRVPIDLPCRALLGSFVERGVARYRREEIHAVHAVSRIDEAVANLRTLLDDMTQQIRIQRFDALHDVNFHSAVERRCPLWPFC